jgi:hypothetical protein
LAIAAGGVEQYAVNAGLGTHVRSSRNFEAIELNFVAIPFNLISSTLAKVSVCFSLQRITEGKIKSILFYALAIALVLFQTFTSIFLFAQCRPVEGLWNPLYRDHCLDPIYNTIVFQVSGGQ